jgi:hypothetical protein
MFTGILSVQKLTLVATLAASAVASFPSAAYADHGECGWHREYDDDDDDNEGPRYRRWKETRYSESYSEPQRRYREYRPDRCGRSNGTTGLIVGAAAGALLGRAVDSYGDRAPGTILGAGAGALLGREVERNHGC